MSDDRPRCMSGLHGHLKPEELAFAMDGYVNGRFPSEVARDLCCGRICIRRRYQQFRAAGIQQKWSTDDHAHD